MAETIATFQHLQSVLTEDDIASLKQACRRHLSRGETIPYALIDCLDMPAFTKIQHLLEERLGRTLYYLNDFYLYTDDTFAAGWHMDTELFVFEHAVNVWILLSPDHVTDPLCFIEELNDTPERFYHSVKIEGDDCTFTNFSSREKTVRSLAAIEETRLHTPETAVGDILVLNPRRFHRTNTSEAKHCLVIKFVFEGPNGLLAATKVPSILWPEVGIFAKLVKERSGWDDVLEGLRAELKTDKGREALNAGFFPEKTALYKRMVQNL